MFSWFRRKITPPSAQLSTDEPLIPVPIPALVALLLNVERTRGTALTEGEVNAVRDACSCIVMTVAHARALAEKRGYDDIDPAHAWEQWQVARRELDSADPEAT